MNCDEFAIDTIVKRRIIIINMINKHIVTKVEMSKRNFLFIYEPWDIEHVIRGTLNTFEVQFMILDPSFSNI